MSLFRRHGEPPAEPDIFGLLTRNRPATEAEISPGVQSFLQEMDHLRRRWGRFFDVCAIHDGGHEKYQDVVVLRRRP